MSNNNIEITLSTGAKLPMRPTVSKQGNLFWAILSTRKDGQRYFNRYGVPVEGQVVGGKLPTSITVMGRKVSGKTEKDDKGRSVVRFSTVLSVEGANKELHLSIKDLGEGTFNVSGSIHGQRGSGGGRKAVAAL